MNPNETLVFSVYGRNYFGAALRTRNHPYGLGGPSGTGGCVQDPACGTTTVSILGGSKNVNCCRIATFVSPRIKDINQIIKVNVSDIRSFCFVPSIEIKLNNNTKYNLQLVSDDSSPTVMIPSHSNLSAMNMNFAVTAYNADTGKYTSTCKMWNGKDKIYTNGSFYKRLIAIVDTAQGVTEQIDVGLFEFKNIGAGHEIKDLKVTYTQANTLLGYTIEPTYKTTTYYDRFIGDYSSLSCTFVEDLNNIAMCPGLWINSDKELVYVTRTPFTGEEAEKAAEGYGAVPVMRGNRVSMFPGMSSATEGSITSMEWPYIISREEITSERPMYWNWSPDGGKSSMMPPDSVTYDIKKDSEGHYTLEQIKCGGFPAAAVKDSTQQQSIEWWKNAKVFFRPIFFIINQAMVNCSKVDKAESELYGMYTAKDGTKVLVNQCYGSGAVLQKDNVQIQPNPGPFNADGNAAWEGDVMPMKFYGVLYDTHDQHLSSGLTRIGGNYFLNKVTYVLIKDSDTGKNMLIQGTCDFSEDKINRPDSKPDKLTPTTLAWWKKAKILTKDE